MPLAFCFYFFKFNFSTNSLKTDSTQLSAFISIKFQFFLYSSITGSVFSIYKSILFNIAFLLSSALFSNLSQVCGSNLVPAGKVSDVLGLYILPNNLAFDFSTDNSNNTTL
jgi:hypothetical protein